MKNKMKRMAAIGSTYNILTYELGTPVTQHLGRNSPTISQHENLVQYSASDSERIRIRTSLDDYAQVTKTDSKGTLGWSKLQGWRRRGLIHTHLTTDNYYVIYLA